MTIDSEDARLTAYALGELPEAEREVLEAELLKAQHLSVEVDDLRDFARLLEADLATSADSELSSDRLGLIEHAAQHTTGDNERRDTDSERDAQLRTSLVRPHSRGKQLAAGALTMAALAAGALLAIDSDPEVRPAIHVTEPVLPAAQPATEEPPRQSLTKPLQRQGGLRRGRPSRDYGAVSPHTRGGSSTGRDSSPPAARRTMPAQKLARRERTEPPEGSVFYSDRPSSTSHSPAPAPRAKKKRVSKNAPRAILDPGFGDFEVRQPIEPKRIQPKRSTERYAPIMENPFVRVADDPQSTFSIDVDTAAYSLVRRHVDEGSLPPRGAVRIEELINYFDYTYPEPSADIPFSVSTEVSTAPWAPRHRLLRIGIKGRHVAASARPDANLVFLIDVSGSMQSDDKLELLKRGFRMLVEQLDSQDKVSIVVYAGASGLVLPATAGNRKSDILGALEQLTAGGSTNGGAGIHLAYSQAREHFQARAINRVILATDGDFNVGVTHQSDLVDLIQRQAQSGVFLSVLGFGRGNYNDATLENLANKGNGNYAYIDTIGEAHRVLAEQAASTLITIAKDVKIQIEMNPRHVEAFRLIGYENRVLSHDDFNDDTKDAGEIGADHSVTALYEVIPKGGKLAGPQGSMLRYQKPAQPTSAANSSELMTLKLRFKTPEGSQSQEISTSVDKAFKPFAQSSADHRFAAAVAALGMLLRGSQHKGSASYAQAIAWAQSGTSGDRERQRFVTLMRKASLLPR